MRLSILATPVRISRDSPSTFSSSSHSDASGLCLIAGASCVTLPETAVVGMLPEMVAFVPKLSSFQPVSSLVTIEIYSLITLPLTLGNPPHIRRGEASNRAGTIMLYPSPPFIFPPPLLALPSYWTPLPAYPAPPALCLPWPPLSFHGLSWPSIASSGHYSFARRSRCTRHVPMLFCWIGRSFLIFCVTY